MGDVLAKHPVDGCEVVGRESHALPRGVGLEWASSQGDHIDTCFHFVFNLLMILSTNL
jgi:hypothetical protein